MDRGPPVFRPHSPLLKRIEPHTLEETVLSSPGIAATTIGKDGVLAPPVRGSLRKAKGKEESMQQHKRFLVHFKDEITVRLAPTDDTLASSRVRTIPLTRDAMEAACSQFLGEESWCGEDDRQRAKLRRGDDSTATKANALGAGGKEVHADEASTGGARYSNGILENLLVVSAWITEEEVARPGGDVPQPTRVSAVRLVPRRVRAQRQYHGAVRIRVELRGQEEECQEVLDGVVRGMSPDTATRELGVMKLDRAPDVQMG